MAGQILAVKQAFGGGCADSKPMYLHQCRMLVFAVMQKGTGIVENKACAADQMPCGIIIDRTIIKKMVEKPSSGITGARRMKIQNAGNVIRGGMPDS